MDLLERYFDIAIKSPDGIKKLREMILSLAMQGKLVPQDPGDPPASELLKQIEAEKKKLIKEGKIKKQEPLLPIKPEEVPYEVPAGWEWVRLGDYTEIIRGITFPANEKTKEAAVGRIGCLRTSNVQETIQWEDLLHIDRSFMKHDYQIVKQNDIIMSMANSRELVGKVAIIDVIPINESTIGGFLSIIRPVIVMPVFLKNLLRTEYARSNIIAKSSQTTNIANISLGKLYPFLVPLPPLAEQKRIVAKIDALMVVCDRLEAERNERNKKRLILHQTAMDQLLSAADAAAFDAAWDFIARNFAVLYSVPENVVELKKAILQLAVMGKLVPQDPGDQPANELLKQIEAEKKKLIKEGKIKKQDPLPPIKPEEVPYEVPVGWEWVRLEGLAHVLAGNSFNSADFSEIAGVKCVKITNAGVHNFIETNDYLPFDFLTRFAQFRVNAGDIIIALTRPFIKDGLKVSICPDSYNGSLLNQRVAAVKAYNINNSKYLFLYLKTPQVLSIFQNRFGNNGLQPNLKMEDIKHLLIPTPPLAEQKRIVAKVDALMALCDTLEKQLKDSADKQTAILGAVLARM